MADVNKLLDRCMEIRSLKNDTALGVALGVSRQAVSGWRHGERFPDAMVCARISDITGEPLARVLGIVGEARALSGDEKKVWRRLAQTAVFALAAVGLTGAPQPSYADDAGTYAQRNALYIMRNWWRSLRRVFSTNRREICASC